LAVLGLINVPDIMYAGIPLEVHRRLEGLYVECVNVISLAIGPLYQHHGELLPSLRIPDHLLMLAVTGPKNSGVDVNFPTDRWVEENMRCAAEFYHIPIDQLRVGPILLRDRQQLILNQTLKVLRIRIDQIPSNIRPFNVWFR